MCLDFSSPDCCQWYHSHTGWSLNCCVNTSCRRSWCFLLCLVQNCFNYLFGKCIQMQRSNKDEVLFFSHYLVPLWYAYVFIFGLKIVAVDSCKYVLSTYSFNICDRCRPKLERKEWKKTVVAIFGEHWSFKKFQNHDTFVILFSLIQKCLYLEFKVF